MLLFTVSVIVSCRDKSIDFVEPQKPIANTWMVSKVMRNQDELTQWIDLTKFKLVLNTDNNYTITNTVLPFITTENGTWSVDDVQYPTKLTLKSSSGQSKTVDIQLPVVDGKRTMLINFSPGCTANVYEYTLQSVN